MLPPKTISAVFWVFFLCIEAPSPVTAQTRQIQAPGECCLLSGFKIYSPWRNEDSPFKHVCRHAAMQPFHCCFAGHFLPVSSVTCKAVVLVLHINTDSQCAIRHILSNLENGIYIVRGVWFSIVTTVTRLWVTQLPLCNSRLSPLKAEKSS